MLHRAGGRDQLFRIFPGIVGPNLLQQGLHRCRPSIPLHLASRLAIQLLGLHHSTSPHLLRRCHRGRRSPPPPPPPLMRRRIPPSSYRPLRERRQVRRDHPPATPVQSRKPLAGSARSCGQLAPPVHQMSGHPGPVVLDVDVVGGPGASYPCSIHCSTSATRGQSSGRGHLPLCRGAASTGPRSWRETPACASSFFRECHPLESPLRRTEGEGVGHPLEPLLLRRPVDRLARAHRRGLRRTVGVI